MPRGIPNMPEGYISPKQAAIRCGQMLPNGKPNLPWIWARLDPEHPDMIPHRNVGTKERPTYQIPIDEFDKWDAAHVVTKGKP